MGIDWSDGKAPAGRGIDDVEQDKLADWVMDDMQLAMSGRMTAHEARSDLDDERAAERRFCQAFPGAVTEQLRGQSIRCTSMMPDGAGTGYHIVCRDEVGRPYQVALSFDEWHHQLTIHGERAGRALVSLIAKRVLVARDAWFRRMQ